MKKPAYILMLLFLTCAAFPSSAEPEHIRLAVINVTREASLDQQAQIIADNFTGALAKSDAITVVEREDLELILREQRINASQLGEPDTASRIGELTGCRYILLSSAAYELSPVIGVRIVEVSTSDIVFSGTELTDSWDGTSIIAASSRLSDQVLEILTGAQAVITDITGSEVTLNRGSSSGVRAGDMYRVYMGTKRNYVNLAVIRVNDVRSGFSSAEIVKGSPEALRRVDKIEAVSGEQASELMKGRKFAKKRPGEKKAADPSVTAMRRISDPLDEATNFLRAVRQSFDVLLEKSKTARETRDPKMYNDIGEEFFGIGLALRNYRNTNALEDAYSRLEAVRVGVPFDTQARIQRNSQWLEKYTDEMFSFAARYFELGARRGNHDAQNNLGVIYVEGLGGYEKDYAKAAELFSQAVVTGDPAAQYNLGMLYAMGWGVEQDYSKALDLYSKAAAQGKIEASVDLGQMYVNGWGVAQDFGRAVQLFTSAADRGNAYGQTSLGMMYLNGYGVPQDAGKAIELFRKAAAQGFEPAQEALKAVGAN